MFAPWTEGAPLATASMLSQDGAGGVKVSNFVESKLRACCIVIAFFSQGPSSFALQTALFKNIA